MSAFDFDDDDQYGQDNETPLVKQLRKQLKELSAANKALTEENGKLAQSTRKATLADILKSKNVNPKLANILSKDEVEATEEAVSKWLDEYGDVFGVQTQATDATPEPQAAEQEDPAVAAFQQSLAQMRSSEVSSTPAAAPQNAALQDLLAKAADVKSSDEFFRLLQGG